MTDAAGACGGAVDGVTELWRFVGGTFIHVADFDAPMHLTLTVAPFACLETACPGSAVSSGGEEVPGTGSEDAYLDTLSRTSVSGWRGLAQPRP